MAVLTPNGYMQNNKTDLYIELLQVSLGMRDCLSRVPSSYEWEKIFKEAKRQAIIGILLDGIARLPQEQLPPHTLKLQWIGMVQMMEATYRLHCERAGELTKRLREKGFESCVLKGVGTAQLYPHPAHRQYGDIDLWVMNGHRKDLMQCLCSEYDVHHVTWHHIEAKIFDDVEVEVHVHPSWLYNPIGNRKLQRFFHQEILARREPSNGWHESCLGFSVPSVEFEAVFSLAHSFHHLIEEGIGLRHIIDYFYILQALPAEKREMTLNVLKCIGLGKFAAAMMWVMREVCGMPTSDLLCEPNEKEGMFLLSEMMAGGNFGQERNDGKFRNSFSRWMMMVKHYPSEVLWMIPWKIWHKGWMMRGQLTVDS